MTRIFSVRFILAALLCVLPSVQSWAAGDLLIAPTRLVLGENGNGEVLLSNKGSEPATYRTSVILKKMRADGQYEDIPQPTPEQQLLIGMLSFAPRKVVLAPGQTQTVRIAVNLPSSFPAGEYRVHMLFRAVPVAGQTIETSTQSGVSIALTPVYGVTIPIVVRKGALDAKVAIENVRETHVGGKQVLALDLLRTGTRSVYGTVRLLKPGAVQPVAELKGVAVYGELERRSVMLALPEATKLSGTFVVRFNEEGDGKAKAVSEIAVTL